MKQLDPAVLGIRDSYRMMIHLITPRPIAWVSTVSPAGVVNVAPFSFFNGVAASPPTLMFSAVNRRDGSPKDTVRNIEATGQFVVNVVSHDMRVPMNATSEELPYEQSELETCGLTALASERVQPPRIAGVKAAFECERLQIVKVGEGPLAANLVIGRILIIHVADEVLDATGNVDPRVLDTIGRMGGEGYTRTTDLFYLPRPGSAGSKPNALPKKASSDS
jgi:flavin reductase (DIM6/NTAB) family NADH-FMN oxidoreductase RutF